MTTRHMPPAGQSLIGKHTASATCPCNPTRTATTKRTASGRGGRHQGYATATITFTHNLIED